MSIVTWDGRILAADTLGLDQDMKKYTRKILKLNDYTYLAWTGHESHAPALVDWYVKGAIVDKYPAFQSTDNWTRLIVVKYDNKELRFKAGTYEQTPFLLPCYDLMAWGSGRDFALGAMGNNATAIEAVEIACRFTCTCGLPVDYYIPIVTEETACDTVSVLADSM